MTFCLDEAFRLHRPFVYRLAMRRLRNHADAEDVTQDVFVALLRRGHTYEGAADFTGWLFRVTQNQVRQFVRARSRRPEGHAETNEMPDAPVVPTCDLQIALRRSLDVLTVSKQRVVLLHHVGGYEHEEIAHLLGCSAVTSRSQLSRACAQLRASLAA